MSQVLNNFELYIPLGELVDKQKALEVLDQVENFAQKCLEENGFVIKNIRSLEGWVAIESSL